MSQPLGNITADKCLLLPPHKDNMPSHTTYGRTRRAKRTRRREQKFELAFRLSDSGPAEHMRDLTECSHKRQQDLRDALPLS